jgi:hypothetical protein
MNKIANARGVVHMHIHPDLPEAKEFQQLLEGQRGKNVDHNANEVFNPAVSKAQFRAMQAAKHGNSTLGIPKSVGEDFAPSGVKRPKGIPERKRK